MAYDPRNPYNHSYNAPTTPHNPVPPPPPHATGPGAGKPYSSQVFFMLVAALLVSFLLMMVCAPFTESSSTGSTTPVNPFVGIVLAIAAALFTGAICSMLILDWRGFFSVRGLFNWRAMSPKKRFWMAVLWFHTCSFMLILYFIRVYMHLPEKFPAFKQRPKLVQREQKAVVIGSVAAAFFLVAGTASAFSTHSIPSTSTSSFIGSNAQVESHTQNAPIKIVKTATPTPKPSPTPTPKPSPTPTPKPSPTPTPKPKPSPTPTPVPVQPTQPPAVTGVNGNPWGYDFNPGSLIYSPAGDFCSYFSCIGNFWNGNGYVMQCADGMYGKSGGIRGSCSHHGGNSRALYSH